MKMKGVGKSVDKIVGWLAFHWKSHKQEQIWACFLRLPVYQQKLGTVIAEIYF